MFLLEHHASEVYNARMHPGLKHFSLHHTSTFSLHLTDTFCTIPKQLKTNQQNHHGETEILRTQNHHGFRPRSH
jgi:hypothetical protein